MNALERKLRTYTRLFDDDVKLISSTVRELRTVPPGTDLIREGESPEDLQVVMSGFAFRYKGTLEGKRQIFAYLLPGDFGDLNVALLDMMDHSIGTVSPCEVALIPRKAVLELLQRPAVAHALWMCSLVDAATLRQWLLNNGRHDAEQRLAHLFCEIHTRLDAVGFAEEGGFDLPVPQSVLADSLAMSLVHVNRSLRAMRQHGLVEFRRRRVTIPDIYRLKEFAEFDPSYLHLMSALSATPRDLQRATDDGTLGEAVPERLPTYVRAAQK